MDEWKKHPSKGFTCSIQTPVIQCCVTIEHKEGNRDKHGRHNAGRLDVWMTKSLHALQALRTGNMQRASRQALMEGQKSVSQQQREHFYLIFICQQTCSIILSMCYLCCLFSRWSISHADRPRPPRSQFHTHILGGLQRVCHPGGADILFPVSWSFPLPAVLLPLRLQSVRALQAQDAEVEFNTFHILKSCDKCYTSKVSHLIKMMRKLHTCRYYVYM